MLKRKLTFFKRYKNSGFSDPVKRYKTSFNMVDRLDAMLGYIPYQWRHSCAANVWFLWFIRVAVVRVRVVGIPLVKTLVEGENIPSGPIAGIA